MVSVFSHSKLYNRRLVAAATAVMETIEVMLVRIPAPNDNANYPTDSACNYSSGNEYTYSKDYWSNTD